MTLLTYSAVSAHNRISTIAGIKLRDKTPRDKILQYILMHDCLPRISDARGTSTSEDSKPFEICLLSNFAKTSEITWTVITIASSIARNYTGVPCILNLINRNTAKFPLIGRDAHSQATEEIMRRGI